MILNKLLCTGFLTVVLSSIFVNVSANEPPANIKDKVAVCASCHGKDGKTPLPNQGIPIIAGQYEDYLVESLRAYQRGARRNLIMTGQAASLSIPEIEALAEYYSSLDGLRNID